MTKGSNLKVKVYTAICLLALVMSTVSFVFRGDMVSFFCIMCFYLAFSSSLFLYRCLFSYSNQYLLGQPIQWIG